MLSLAFDDREFNHDARKRQTISCLKNVKNRTRKQTVSRSIFNKNSNFLQFL
jgi:hypothetical protein